MMADEFGGEQQYNNKNSNNGPLNQNLILKLVLEHVGSANKADLKNCRLVSHSWNRVAVLVLEQQHDSALHLDFAKLSKFRSLLWQTELSRTKAEGKELASLRLALNVLVRDCPEFPGQEVCNSHLSKAIQLLRLNPHLRVVRIGLVCEIIARVEEGADAEENNFVNRKLFSLLKLSSQTLLDFKLSCVGQPRRRPHHDDFDFDSYQPLTFPRLTSLCYQVANNSGEDVVTDGRNTEQLDLTRHVISIIQGAPKLHKLRLDIWEGSVEGTANSLRELLESCSTHLEEFEITEGVEEDEEILKVLTELQFPLLRLVKMKNGLFYTNKWFNQFLTHSCPALTGLKVEWTDMFEVAEDLTLEFPVLPKIVSLDLQLFYYNKWTRYLERVHLTFTTLLRKLPSLQSLNIDLGVLFMLGAHFRKSGQLVPQPEQYPVFPNICSLELRIPDILEKMMPLMDICLGIYQHTFPNMEKLVIKPLVDESMPRSREAKQRLARAIEILCFHPGIRVLEIHNYASAFMDQIMNGEAGYPYQSLEGLKSLKLLPPEASSSSSRTRPPQMKVMELITRFPSLEFLQFGKQVASRAELESVRGIVKRFDQPTSPN